VLGDARVDRFRFALEIAFGDENVDSVLVILSPSAVAEPENTARAVLEIKDKYPYKPVFAVYMGGKTLVKGRGDTCGKQRPHLHLP